LAFHHQFRVADLSVPTDDHKQLIERADQALCLQERRRNQTDQPLLHRLTLQRTVEAKSLLTVMDKDGQPPKLGVLAR
jgi:hypothetical protein